VHLRRCLHRFDGPHAEAGTGRNLAYSSAEATCELSGVRRSRALSKVTFKLVLFTLARVTASAANWQGYDGLELALSSLLVLCSSVGFGGRRNLTWRCRISRSVYPGSAAETSSFRPWLSDIVSFIQARGSSCRCALPCDAW
jgi:hypothetical protein